MIKRQLIYLVLLLSLAGVLYSLYHLNINIKEYRISSNKYEQLQRIYEQPETDEHEQLKQINQDYVGWLSIDDLDLQYPVVHPENNEFYLTHNFYKEEDHAGAIFMDYRNTRGDLGSNTIIYGHNMKDNSMFASLKKIMEEDFSEENSIIFDFQNEQYEWKIFSAYVTRDADWMQVDFDSKDSYTEFIDDLKRNSNRSFSTEVTEKSKIITLATCTSHVSDERVVVHAILVKGNE